MKFLFVANTRRDTAPYYDPSVRYRCYNIALDLQELGHVADVLPFSLFTLDLVAFYDVIIVHRPRYDEQLEQLVEQAHKHKTSLFASYDDLLFSKRDVLSFSGYRMGQASEKEALSFFAMNEKALKLFDQVLVSTVALEEKVLEVHPSARTVLVYNGLHVSFLEKAREFRRIKRKDRGCIAYFSGTRTHEYDFEIVKEPLRQFIQNSSAHLLIVGQLSAQSDIKHSYYPSVPYDELPRLIYQADVNIAPLEDTIFNDCKSGLKFYEAAALGVPSVVSPARGMLRFKDSDALLYAHTPEQWGEHFNRLLSDDIFYEDLSMKAYHYALRECLSMTQTKNFLKAVK